VVVVRSNREEAENRKLKTENSKLKSAAALPLARGCAKLAAFYKSEN
jgi:hypothetical protein